jgi:hypothetical protein
MTPSRIPPAKNFHDFGLLSHVTHGWYGAHSTEKRQAKQVFHSLADFLAQLLSIIPSSGKSRPINTGKKEC